MFVSCARTSQDKALQNKCVEVLLRFLSHPLPEVKEQTYSTIKQVVKVSLLCQDLLSIQNKCTTLAHNLSRILEVLVKNCNKCLYCALFIDQFDKNQEGFETCTPKEYCSFINVYLFVDAIIAQACVDSWWIILIVYLFFRAPSMWTRQQTPALEPAICPAFCSVPTLCMKSLCLGWMTLIPRWVIGLALV